MALFLFLSENSVYNLDFSFFFRFNKSVSIIFLNYFHNDLLFLYEINCFYAMFHLPKGKNTSSGAHILSFRAIDLPQFRNIDGEMLNF